MRQELAGDPPVHLLSIEDFEPIIGAEAAQRISHKADSLHDLHIENVSSTYYGGGVAAILSSLTLLMNSAGIKTGWRIIQGRPDFFSITKKMHNALQGGDINLSDLKKSVYEEVAYENAARLHFDHDCVIIHDPQPLPLITYYRKKTPWIWRCHVDLSKPHPGVLEYLMPFIECFDAVVLSLPEYAQKLTTPQRFIMPAINPFSTTNKDLSREEIRERLENYDIPTDLPLVVQVSRFDPWKDPLGVVRAFNMARKEVDCRLVLVGNAATDDPEGQAVLEQVLRCADDHVRVLFVQDSALVNALQRSAAVVVQKSVREGFGLTVTEAMWKGAAVVGGNVGGIRHQIEDGVNGFLVNNEEETARRIVELVQNQSLRARLGRRAKETVAKRFLMTRLMEDWLDLIASFQATFPLRSEPEF